MNRLFEGKEGRRCELRGCFGGMGSTGKMGDSGRCRNAYSAQLSDYMRLKSSGELEKNEESTSEKMEELKRNELTTPPGSRGRLSALLFTSCTLHTTHTAPSLLLLLSSFLYHVGALSPRRSDDRPPRPPPSPSHLACSLARSALPLWTIRKKSYSPSCENLQAR